MDRRNAIAIAIAVGGTVLASGAAFAANVGLLQEDDDPVGQLETTNVSDLLDGSTSTSTPQTIVIDVPVGSGTDPAGTGVLDDDGTPDQGPGDAGTVTGSGRSDDDGDDDGIDDDSDDGSDDDAFDDHGGVDDHDDD